MFYDFCSGIKIEYFGESHASFLELRLSGIEAGHCIDLDLLQTFLNRRKSGVTGTTERNEEDVPEILSGIIPKSTDNGIKEITNGEMIVVRVYNKDINKVPYEKYKGVVRPSTADYPAIIKYGEKYGTGGGKFSARMTVLLCIAGGIIIQILSEKGIKINSQITSVGKVKNRSVNDLTGEIYDNIVFDKKMTKEVCKIKKRKDSLGGIIECSATGIPIGIGGADFDGLESKISNIIFSIPSVKGVEFGNGFKCAVLKGSQNNDEIAFEDNKIKFFSNNAGGLLGGMSNGMPMIVRVAFKPIPTIGVPLRTVNLKTGENTLAVFGGRHDVCAVLRAKPIVESAVAIGIYTAMANEQKSLEKQRNKINIIDDKIFDLLAERCKAVKIIGKFKKETGMAVKDKIREKKIEEKIALRYAEEKDYILSVYKEIFNISEREQKK